MFYEENTITNFLSRPLALFKEKQTDRRRSRFATDQLFSSDFLLNRQEDFLEKDVMVPKLNRHRSSKVESTFSLEFEPGPPADDHAEEASLKLVVSLEQEKRGSFCPEFMKTNSTSLREEVLRVFQEENNVNFSDEESEEENVCSSLKVKTSTFVPFGQSEESISPPIQETFHNNFIEANANFPEGKKRGRKSPFHPEDDKLLEELVQKHGEKNWSKIASIMTKFNRKQLRERYINFIKKKYVFTEFTEEEDEKIVECVEKFGRKWERISEEFENRSPIMIKNHYVNSILKGKSGKSSVERESSSDSDYFPSGNIEAPSATSSTLASDFKGGKRAWNGSQYQLMCPSDPLIRDQIESATQQISNFQLQ